MTSKSEALKDRMMRLVYAVLLFPENHTAKSVEHYRLEASHLPSSLTNKVEEALQASLATLDASERRRLGDVAAIPIDDDVFMEVLPSRPCSYLLVGVREAYRLDKETLSVMMHHELSHIRHHDVLKTALVRRLLPCAIFAAWVCASPILGAAILVASGFYSSIVQRPRELRCDREAIRTSKDALLLAKYFEGILAYESWLLDLGRKPGFLPHIKATLHNVFRSHPKHETRIALARRLEVELASRDQKSGDVGRITASEPPSISDTPTLAQTTQTSWDRAVSVQTPVSSTERHSSVGREGAIGGTGSNSRPIHWHL